MRRQEGVALLWFRMTPAGEVLAFRLERSSGHALLDQETLELIKRAQPLPALPPDMPQQPIELVLPLRYELRRRSCSCVKGPSVRWLCAPYVSCCNS